MSAPRAFPALPQPEPGVQGWGLMPNLLSGKRSKTGFGSKAVGLCGGSGSLSIAWSRGPALVRLWRSHHGPASALWQRGEVPPQSLWAAAGAGSHPSGLPVPGMVKAVRAGSCGCFAVDSTQSRVFIYSSEKVFEQNPAALAQPRVSGAARWPGSLLRPGSGIYIRTACGLRRKLPETPRKFADRVPKLSISWVSSPFSSLSPSI